MLTIEPTGAVLGATVRGVDLAQPLSRDDFGRILLELGRYGVLRFPDQHLDLGALKRFSEQFGEIQGSPTRDLDKGREYPEIDILSNLKEDGRHIGSPDAGQDWHTDMTYRDVAGFVNVLYGIRIPHRDGKPLGGTEFANMHAAYDDLRRGHQDAARRYDRDPQYRKILGAYAPEPWQPAPADDRRATPPPAARRASGVSDAPDHWPQSTVLQPRFHSADQRTARARQ